MQFVEENERCAPCEHYNEERATALRAPVITSRSTSLAVISENSVALALFHPSFPSSVGVFFSVVPPFRKVFSIEKKHCTNYSCIYSFPAIDGCKEE